MATLEQELAIGAEETGATTELAPLTGLDRCDSCGAGAYVRAVMGESELLFCAHHARQHEAKLKPLADDWQDESHKLSVQTADA